MEQTVYRFFDLCSCENVSPRTTKPDIYWRKTIHKITLFRQQN